MKLAMRCKKATSAVTGRIKMCLKPFSLEPFMLSGFAGLADVEAAALDACLDSSVWGVLTDAGIEVGKEGESELVLKPSLSGVCAA